MRDIRSQLSDWPSDSIEDAFECPAQHLGIIYDQLGKAYTHKQRSIWEIHSSRGHKAVHVAHSLECVINRHAMLRSVFVPSLDNRMEPIQVVLKEISAAIQIVTASDIKAAVQLQEFKAIQCRDRPLPHLSILTDGPDGQIWWLFKFDKALIDAASMTIVLQELATLLNCHSCPLDLAPSYSKYVSAVHEIKPKQCLRFWRRTLRGIVPCLLTKSPSSLLRCPSPEPRVCTVSKELTALDTLAALWKASGFTATNAFQTVWGLVLARSIAPTDVCYGGLKSCRDAAVPGILQRVGPLFNILPCRLQFKSVHPTMSELSDILLSNQSAMAERAPTTSIRLYRVSSRLLGSIITSCSTHV
ncbi:condensation domain-containing protein [Aspergillus pseudonomiae]|uniref:Condensation domain-containing protein n=1 Tax=Aspergillus pseudonomiae TaxID=1506151 RepID=A0A5N6I6H4_9EURO|nr:condensation domain-containing protein [Aspergillus pseudonomiae]KAB8262282.1 condensation domain-containing protein [Aspergillus pseudonomiae]KAE8407107.1 condensation domain-containing protein [Aspergillus pseudonomiae]